MSHRLQILIPESLDARLSKAASRCRLSKAEWVRRVIERELAAKTPEEDALTKMAALGAPTADIAQMLTEIESGRQ